MFKNIKRYFKKSDYLSVFGMSTVISGLVAIAGGINSNIWVDFLFFSVSFFLTSCILSNAVISRNMRKEYRLDMFKKVIEEDELKYGNIGVQVSRNFYLDHVTYFFESYDKVKLLELTYDFETLNFSENFVHPDFLESNEYFEVRGSLKDKIRLIHQENTYQIPKVSNEILDTFGDEITKGIDTLRELSIELLSDKSYLSLEETHLVKETIPTELAQLKYVYLSFRAESRTLYQKKTKENMREIKSALDSLVKKVEEEKAKELLKSEVRIREKITKRL